MTRRFGKALARNDNLRLVAFYHGGTVVGPAWIGLVGGAYLVGPVPEDGAGVTGNSCIYIYPDLKAAIVGRFEDSHLIEGRAVTIVGTRMENHILVPVVEELGAGVPANLVVTRDVSTNQRISRYDEHFICSSLPWP